MIYYRLYIVKIIEGTTILYDQNGTISQENIKVLDDDPYFITLKNMIYDIQPFNDHRLISDIGSLTTYNIYSKLQPGEMYIEMYDVISNKERIIIPPTPITNKSLKYTVLFHWCPTAHLQN